MPKDKVLLDTLKNHIILIDNPGQYKLSFKISLDQGSETWDNISENHSTTYDKLAFDNMNVKTKSQRFKNEYLVEIVDNHTDTVREILKSGFGIQSLKEFCYDRIEYREIYPDIRWENATKSDIVHRIMVHTVRKRIGDVLLNWISLNNPDLLDKLTDSLTIKAVG